MQTRSNHILASLREAGYRITCSREAIIRVLSIAEDWVKPDDILLRAREECPSIGLVTVYRTLALLLDLGFIRRIHFEDGCHGYVRADLAHGHHLVCRSCQQVVEFPGTEDLTPLINAVQETTGFRIDEHMLELVGLCPECL